NLLAAMAHAIDAQDLDVAMGLTTSSMFGPYGHGYGRLAFAAEPVLALPGAQRHPSYPRALMHAAFQAMDRGELGLARQRCAAALETARALAVPDPGLPLDVIACWLHYQVAMATGAFRESAAVLLEGADRVSGSEFASLGASLLSSAAGSLGFAGDFEAAVPIATRSL